MMKSIQRAAKENQEGSSLLEVEETSKALRQFRSALNHLNECGHSSLDSLPSSALSGTTVRSTPIRLGEDYRTAHLPEDERKPGDLTILYSEAFVFEHQDGVMTVEKHRFCSAILIFNTALALHQKAGKEDGHKAYLKALLFYREAKTLLAPMLNNAESFRILQEIMKNKVDIYYRLNDLGNAQLIWEELSELTKKHHLAGNGPRAEAALSA